MVRRRNRLADHRPDVHPFRQISLDYQRTHPEYLQGRRTFGSGQHEKNRNFRFFYQTHQLLQSGCHYFSRLPCQIPPRYAVPHLGDTAPEGISDKGIRAERRTLQTIWAVSGKTAAELIYYRANADLPLMGLTSTAYPDKVLKSDIVIGKNYLSEEEINMLKLIVEQFLAFAEAQAAAHKPMYMKDWIDKLRLVLTMNEKSVLEDAGRISHQLALKKAEQEYNKYKEIKLSQGHWDSIKELDEDLKRLQSQSRKKGRGSGGFFK